jgi:ribosomal protein S18 acetylase RimI-like enzyme
MKKLIRIMPVTIDEEISSITDFYNSNFPKAQNEERYKRHMYRKECYKAIVLIIKLEGRIIGLLESWIPTKRPNIRLFTTLLVDESFRNQGLGKKLIETMFEITTQENEQLPVVVNFRDCNKTTHIPFYKKFGFENPSVVGNYANGDPMWEMQKQCLI